MSERSRGQGHEDDTVDPVCINLKGGDNTVFKRWSVVVVHGNRTVSGIDVFGECPRHALDEVLVLNIALVLKETWKKSGRVEESRRLFRRSYCTMILDAAQGALRMFARIERCNEYL